MGDRVVIDGVASLRYTIDGNATLRKIVDGQAGVFMPVYPEIYDGETVVIPMAFDAQVLPCKNKTMPDDVTVTKVPYFETSNEDGTTVYIASEVQ